MGMPSASLNYSFTRSKNNNQDTSSLFFPPQYRKYQEKEGERLGRGIRSWSSEPCSFEKNNDNKLRMPGLTTVCWISRDCLPERVRHLTAFFATLTRLATVSKIVCTIAVIYKDCKLHIYFLHQLNTLLIFWLTYIFNRKVFVYEHTPDI